MSECKHRKPNGVCVIDTEVVYRGYCVDSPCSCFEPQTNADKIRAMSDEEISEWFWWMLDYVKSYTDSRLALIDWLKKEAEE